MGLVSTRYIGGTVLSHEVTTHQQPQGKYLLLMSMGALGIVYGDIGTSPLYALRECFFGSHGVGVSVPNVLGVLSLIFWSLIIVISIKYLVFVLRADNNGEGGIIALMSLIIPHGKQTGKRRFTLVAMGLFGAALLYGDGMITPAISVLSAIEGLEVATPFFKPYVVPITLAILLALFLVQRRGTGGIGKVFGPVTLVWFIVLALLGVVQIVQSPSVIAAVNPLYGFRFFTTNGWHGFLVLGSVFLVVTGGEALYADLGHFGKRPIRLAWFTVVLPGLLLNYFGQAALLLSDPEAQTNPDYNPFYGLVPEWGLYPMVILAAAATVIASQALISGAFSLTRQAVQLGYMPRVVVEHTSARAIGQIYIPGVNWILMIACMGLVFGFRSSSALAAAYGVAVTTNMVFTSLLLAVVARVLWRWKISVIVALSLVFLGIDVSFWGANLIKVPDGGWVPLVMAAIVFTIMTSWKRGRELLDARLRADALPIDVFVKSIAMNPPHRVSGTAVFMFRNLGGTPTALLHNLKHNKVLHEKVVLLTVVTTDTPHVEADQRSSLVELGNGLFQLELRYGFMEDPNVPSALRLVSHPNLGELDPMQISYFLGRETLIATRHPGMAIWREKLFATMSKNARNAADFFCIPANRVIELGAQVEI